MDATPEVAAPDRDDEAANEAGEDAGERMFDQSSACGCPVQKAETDEDGNRDDQADAKGGATVRNIEINDAKNEGREHEKERDRQHSPGVEPGRDDMPGAVQGPFDNIGDPVARCECAQGGEMVAQSAGEKKQGPERADGKHRPVTQGHGSNPFNERRSLKGSGAGNAAAKNARLSAMRRVSHDRLKGRLIAIV